MSENCIICGVGVGKDARVDVTKAVYGPYAVEGPAHRRCLDMRGIEPVDWGPAMPKPPSVATVLTVSGVIIGVLAAALYYIFIG